MSKKAYASAIIAVSLWGTTFAVAKLVTPNPLNPITFTAIRTVLGFSVLFGFLLVTKQIGLWWAILRKHLLYLSLLGICGYALAYFVQYWGLSKTSSINQSILSNTQTFWVVLINLTVFHRKPKRFFLIASFITFIGVIVVITRGSISISSATLIGDLISLFAFVLWGSYTAFTKPISMKEKSIFVTTTIIFWAMLVLIPIALISGGWTEIQKLSLSQWGIMAYLGIACVGFTFILWTFALSDKSLPSENISLITMLNPIVGILTAIIVLGEHMTLQIFVGMIIVLTGLILAERNSIPKQEPKMNSRITNIE